MGAAAPALRRGAADEKAFTVVEMVIAMTLMAVSLLALAQLLFGSIAAAGATRQRSVFLEIATAEMESLRATAYDAVGVDQDDPNRSAAYPSGTYGGCTAVVVDNPEAPAAVSTHAATDERPAYTVRRWVTHTGVSGGCGSQFKRLAVAVEWQDRKGASHTLDFTSVLYPGGLGEVVLDNDDPTVTVTATPTSVLVGGTITFTATASDPDAGDVLTYTWDFGDGTAPIVGSAGISHTYNASNTFTAQVTVSDGNGGSAIASADVAVGVVVNTAPNSSFTGSPTSGVAPFTVNVDASGSTDPEGQPLIYTWDWGDGTAAGNGVNASHSFSAAGTQTIVLTVTDTGGLSDTSQLNITVIPLTCDVTSGYFRNPSTNPLQNDIKVASNGKPNSTSFEFTATSNAACTSIAGRIAHSSGTLAVTLVNTSTVGGVKTWVGTGSVGASVRFNVGAAQTGEFWSPSTTGATDKFPFTFSVHR